MIETKNWIYAVLPPHLSHTGDTTFTLCPRDFWLREGRDFSGLIPGLTEALAPLGFTALAGCEFEFLGTPAEASLTLTGLGMTRSDSFTSYLEARGWAKRRVAGQGVQPKETSAEDRKSLTQLMNTLELCEYRDERFAVGKMGNGWYLQLTYMEDCIETGERHMQKSRKWYVSRFAVKSEIIQTAFKAVMTSMEHRAREHFRYRGKAVFGPHYNVDVLWEVCGNTERRPAPGGARDER